MRIAQAVVKSILAQVMREVATSSFVTSLSHNPSPPVFVNFVLSFVTVLIRFSHPRPTLLPRMLQSDYPYR
jgi:hypothetical protein